MTIEHVPLSRLKPYWRNPRHNKAAVAMVVESIRQFGFNVPITVDEQYVIVTGHTRYQAAVQEKLKTVPIIVLRHLSADQIKAFRVADNKTQEVATWDMDLLKQELRELPDLAQMDFFFPDINLFEMIAQDTGATNFRDVTEQDVVRAKTKLGTQFEGAGRRAMQTVICPHCGEEFEIDA